MKSFFSLFFLVALLTISGCIKAPFQPPMGTIYNNTSAPLTTEYNKADIGNKKGSGEATSILGLFAFGDLSTQSAAKSGNIKTIKYVDYEYMNFLGIIQRTTVNVYGD